MWPDHLQLYEEKEMSHKHDLKLQDVSEDLIEQSMTTLRDMSSADDDESSQ